MGLIVAAAGCTADPTPSGSPSAAEETTPVPSPAATPTPGATQILPPDAGDGSDGPTTPAPLPTTSADIDEPIAFDTGIEVSITDVSAIEVTAETPGEVSGSAVRVTVEVANDSTEPQSFDSAVVTVVAADDTLGIGTTAGSPSPLSGTVDPGATATGTYVFMLDSAADREVTVSVNYAAGEPVAVFTGKVS